MNEDECDHKWLPVLGINSLGIERDLWVHKHENARSKDEQEIETLPFKGSEGVFNNILAFTCGLLLYILIDDWGAGFNDKEGDSSNDNHVESNDLDDQPWLNLTVRLRQMVSQIIGEVFSTNNVLIVENGTLVQYHLHDLDKLAEENEAGSGSLLLRCTFLLQLAETIAYKNQKCNSKVNPSESKESSLVIEEVLVIWILFFHLLNIGFGNEETASEQSDVEHDMSSCQRIAWEWFWNLH